MSDFDAALERLVTDPGFAGMLAADPDRALAGYRLTADEAALLHTQVGVDTGHQSGVEVRANQSSLFGMLSPLAGVVGALPALDGYAGGGMGPAGETGMGSSAGVGGSGAGGPQGAADPAVTPTPIGGALDHGLTTGVTATGAPVGGPLAEGSGLAGASPDPASGVTGFGSSGFAPPEGFGSAAALAARDGMDARDGSGVQDGLSAQEGLGPASGAEVPAGYRTRVDVDGDGTWDQHLVRGRAGGGVEILVDANGDGRVDFIGHDTDADGLIEISEYDRNHDGFFERRMYDDNGDGWMDRSVRVERPDNPHG